MRNGPVIRIGPGEEFPDNTPKQYLQGWVEFYKLKFKVTPDVLIPRPETELLVDEVREFILRATSEKSKSSKFSLRSNNINVLDLGTGSGNIAISIAKNLPKAKIFATDVSEAALEVAKENAKKHRVDKRIFFIQSDLLSSFHLKGGNLNVPEIIVTNLPYIPSARIPYLDPSVKDFEPVIALDGGSDGFDLYRKLFEQIVDLGLHLKGTKLIVCEIDYTQGELAVSEAQKYFPKTKVEVKTDLAKKQRILLIKF